MTTPGIVQTGRRLLARFLLDRCVIYDAVRTRDATGGMTTTHTPRALGTPCRWGRPSDSEATVVGATVSGDASVALSLPIGTVIREGDRVRNVADDRMHEVVANMTPSSVMATQVRVLVREV
jgi:hypothetical protein